MRWWWFLFSFRIFGDLERCQRFNSRKITSGKRQRFITLHHFPWWTYHLTLNILSPRTLLALTWRYAELREIFHHRIVMFPRLIVDCFDLSTKNIPLRRTLRNTRGQRGWQKHFCRSLIQQLFLWMRDSRWVSFVCLSAGTKSTCFLVQHPHAARLPALDAYEWCIHQLVGRHLNTSVLNHLCRFDLSSCETLRLLTQEITSVKDHCTIFCFKKMGLNVIKSLELCMKEGICYQPNGFDFKKRLWMDGCWFTQGLRKRKPFDVLNWFQGSPTRILLSKKTRKTISTSGWIVVVFDWKLQCQRPDSFVATKRNRSFQLIRDVTVKTLLGRICVKANEKFNQN